ncbi:hypothetical protein CKY47_12120 [Saccharothrix yanglingensis]|uniref:Uncharacterized protein n=1 Tax=Saccharothrix yanglingensis TaxID=659496 RepID=A0ABU0WXX6_9PSEU|nr:hypothetical protein [Saccharothrix yanglingensis]
MARRQDRTTLLRCTGAVGDDVHFPVHAARNAADRNTPREATADMTSTRSRLPVTRTTGVRTSDTHDAAGWCAVRARPALVHPRDRGAHGVRPCLDHRVLLVQPGPHDRFGTGAADLRRSGAPQEPKRRWRTA